MAASDMPDFDGPGLADFLPDTSGGYTAKAGTPLVPQGASDDASDVAAGSLPGKASEEGIITALMTVKDPEIPVNIYDLGLIYDIIRHEDGNVDITMSLTAPGCPVAGEMPGQVARAVAERPDVGQVSVTLIWDPAWTPDRMSEDAKLALDLDF